MNALLCLACLFYFVPLRSENEKLVEIVNIIEELRNELSEKGVLIQQLQETVEEQGKRLEYRIHELEQRENRRGAVTPVAFTAVKTGGRSNIDTGGVLTFDKVHVNIGDSYNTSSSHFVCPVHGVYYFNFNVFSGELVDSGPSYQDGSFWELVLDGDGDIVEARSDTTDIMGSISVTTTASALVTCAAGGHVWVRSMTAYSQAYSEETIPTVSFTGFLLYET